MKNIFLLFLLLNFVISCSTKPKPQIKNEDLEIVNLGIIDLNKKDFRLKIGPIWFDNESKIHLVFGVTEENINNNFITELHFNFGGNIECENKALSAKFDFKNSSDLILSDSINKLLEATKNIIERKHNNQIVEFDFKNPSPGILVFAIEKVNLKPNNKINNVDLKITSQCLQYINLPLILAKYNVLEIDELINKYIKNELNSLTEKDLKNIKVIFSYNKIHKAENYLVDMVDQRSMKILYYSFESKEYIITDFEKKITNRIKRST